MERPFYIDDLKPGMITAETIKDPKSGAKLITAGQPLTERIIQLIKNRGIKECVINLSEKDMKLYQLNNDVMPTVDRIITESAKKSIIPYRVYDKIFVNVQEVIDSADKIKSRLLNKKEYDSKQFSYRLTSYKNEKKASDQSVRVATFATVLANAYNSKVVPSENIDLTTIATAALLHNFGVICEDDSIREKIKLSKLGNNYPTITDEKVEELVNNYDSRYVPLYSYSLLNDMDELKNNSVLKAIVLNSYENRHATGPLKSKAVENGVKPYIIASLILSLCIEYDKALTEHINDKSTLENVQAFLGKIMSTKVYDKALIELLISNIPLYPVGTKVKLAGGDNDYAVVVQNFNTISDYHRPKVVTVPGLKQIDLRLESTITIESVVGSEVDFSKLYAEQAKNTEIKGKTM